MGQVSGDDASLVEDKVRASKVQCFLNITSVMRCVDGFVCIAVSCVRIGAENAGSQVIFWLACVICSIFKPFDGSVCLRRSATCMWPRSTFGCQRMRQSGRGLCPTCSSDVIIIEGY
jgi:hypothetical protein